MKQVRWLTLLLLLAAVGCAPSRSAMPTGVLPPAYPSATPGALGSLVQEGAAGQNEIQQNLNAPIQINFPVRLGILFYGFTPELKPDHLQEVMTTLDTELKATGLVATTTTIPASLTRPGDSLENLRKLASRFGVDMVLLVQGNTYVERANTQPGGFFDQFGNRVNYESRSVLTGLGLSVLSGRFTQPLQAVGKEGPQALNPEDPSFLAAQYDLKKGAESKALVEMKNQLKESLEAIKATQAGAPAPSASPSVSPSPSPTPTPSASASPAS